MGGEAPLMPKNGYFKAEGLNIGWVGKIRNNRNFRIIGQGSKLLIINNLILFIGQSKIILP